MVEPVETTGRATGTWRLVRFYLRRDRVTIACWVAGTVFMYWTQAYGVDQLYATQAEFDAAAASMAENAAFIAMAGPPLALNTVGGQVAWQCAAFGAVLAGLMSMFLAGRHTRVEEETGRDELIRAAAVDRAAPLIATAIVVTIANLVLGAAIAVVLIGYGLTVPGSVALGVAAAEAGWVFGAVTLVAVQLASATRPAYAITGIAMGAAYAIRAVGDVAGNGLSWASPIGWGQYLRAYAGEQWWPVLLSPLAVGALGVAAARLFDRRDIGSGVWQPKPGPPRADDRLVTPLGLAWRLQRAAVAAWCAGMFLFGAFYGTIGDDVGELLGESEFADEMFDLDRADLVDSFYATSAAILALMACGFAVSSVRRLQAEESAGRAELVLATAVGRGRWAAAQLLVTLGGSVLVVLAAGLGLGSGYAAVTGDGGAIARLGLATLPQAVPVALVAAVAWCAYGLWRRLTGVGWAVLAWAVLVLLFGATLQLPGWLRRTSPFDWLALQPYEPFQLAPFAGLLAVVAALTATGFATFTRRDLG